MWTKEKDEIGPTSLHYISPSFYQSKQWNIIPLYSIFHSHSFHYFYFFYHIYIYIYYKLRLVIYVLHKYLK